MFLLFANVVVEYLVNRETNVAVEMDTVTSFREIVDIDIDIPTALVNKDEIIQKGFSIAFKAGPAVECAQFFLLFQLY